MKSEMKDKKDTYSIDKDKLYAYCIEYPERIKLFVSFDQGTSNVHCNVDTKCRDCLGYPRRYLIKVSSQDTCYIIHVDLIHWILSEPDKFLDILL